ncbi:MAG: helix-turn-helix domain-containing protein [Brevibacterium aurantiacum]|uniref:Excisionase n=1 Tax=Brevibacterium aurantiacum TaxID=273384 RepID=A0A2A3ZAJ6_BREAU|nr:helix-turn-helix domain-containing protein [Brevibacterium aurantiacum]PCC48491.1 excisionase [Brevibacterium aurantiacum]
MSTSAAAQDTFYVPGDQGTGEVYDFIEAHAAKTGSRPEPRFYLSGPDAGDQVELPHEIYEILVKAVDAMRSGMAVTITPNSLTMTTQQAAEILGVTRPTLVKLLDEGKIPFEKPNTHRRVRLADVLEYKEHRKAEQHEAIAEMSDYTDDEESREQALARMKKARKIVANRRHQAHGSMTIDPESGTDSTL